VGKCALRRGSDTVRAVPVLFVLLPNRCAPDEFLAAIPVVDRSTTPIRVYPIASDRPHFLSLVRDGRDPAATRWLAGTVKCVVGGSALGCATATTLAIGFDMLGGFVGLAVGFGAAVGAFLGGFTAAMTGTERARDELLALIDRATFPCRLLQIGPLPRDDARLPALKARCDEIGAPRCVCD
jgi:hypothetical protein